MATTILLTRRCEGRDCEKEESYGFTMSGSDFLEQMDAAQRVLSENTRDWKRIDWRGRHRDLCPQCYESGNW